MSVSMATVLTLDALCAEYELWLVENRLPAISADEHNLEALTPSQREWLLRFIVRWDDTWADEVRRNPT